MLRWTIQCINLDLQYRSMRVISSYTIYTRLKKRIPLNPFSIIIISSKWGWPYTTKCKVKVIKWCLYDNFTLISIYFWIFVFVITFHMITFSDKWIPTISLNYIFITFVYKLFHWHLPQEIIYFNIMTNWTVYASVRWEHNLQRSGDCYKDTSGLWAERDESFTY